LIQIFNHCFGPVGYNDGLRAAAVTVDLSDYRRACSDFPDLAEVKPAPALCVDYVVSVAFAMLPLDDKGPHGRSGQVELVFDRNERFERTIRPVFDRRKGYHRLIAGVTSARSENTPALQAADILAWCANRGYAQGDSFFGIAPMLAAQSLMKLFGYDEIVKRYKMALDLRAASVGKID
jgi:hypothetical protein